MITVQKELEPLPVPDIKHCPWTKAAAAFIQSEKVLNIKGTFENIWATPRMNVEVNF